MNDEIKRLLLNYKTKELKSIEELKDLIIFSSKNSYPKIKNQIRQKEKEIQDIDNIIENLE